MWSFYCLIKFNQKLNLTVFKCPDFIQQNLKTTNANLKSWPLTNSLSNSNFYTIGHSILFPQPISFGVRSAPSSLLRRKWTRSKPQGAKLAPSWIRSLSPWKLQSTAPGSMHFLESVFYEWLADLSVLGPAIGGFFGVFCLKLVVDSGDLRLGFDCF